MGAGMIDHTSSLHIPDFYFILLFRAPPAFHLSHLSAVINRQFYF
jgi:hypothetical protein